MLKNKTYSWHQIRTSAVHVLACVINHYDVEAKFDVEKISLDWQTSGQKTPLIELDISLWQNILSNNRPVVIKKVM